MALPVGVDPGRLDRPLSTWRVDEYPGHVSGVVDLEHDPEGQLRGEELPEALRTESELGESPGGRRLNRQQRALPGDDEGSFILGLVLSNVGVEHVALGLSKGMAGRSR
jgi:hypothetical protein